MKNKITYGSILIPFALFAVALTSCEKTIEFKGKVLDPKIVVYSVLNPDSLVRTYLSSSHAVFDEDFSYKQLTGANVSLYRDGVLEEKLAYIRPQEYQGVVAVPELTQYSSSTLRPRAGSTYRLEVTMPGYQDARTETILPDAVPLLGVDTATVVQTDDEFGYTYTEWEIGVRFRDPPVDHNFYRLIVREEYGYYVGDKSLPYTNDFPVVISSYDIYVESDDPLLSPDAESGIFGTDESNSFSVFSDELIDGKEHVLNFSLGYNPEPPDTAYHEFHRIVIYFQSITEDLYSYLRSYSAQWSGGDGVFTEPVIVYSNVEGGLGVFGACTSSKFDFTRGNYPEDGVFYQTDQDYYNDNFPF